MADFNLPFAANGERREPTADEQDGGFGCGPANLPLFNWMFFALQAEINKVMLEGGITPSNGDMTQLWQAIQAMIDAATGGGDTSTYLLLAQARARLPIFPDVQNTNGHFGMTSPGTGQVRIPSGVIFQHRGIFPVTTVQTDFATDASKTYHVRWNPTDGFTLKDLASGVYNPSTLAEANAAFDSTYDDMLVARVVTNSSNVPTITNLINRAKITFKENQTPTDNIIATGPPGFSYSRDMTFTYNWARSPQHVTPVAALGASAAGGSVGIDGVANLIRFIVATRYTTTFNIVTDFNGVISGPYVDATLIASG